MRQFRALARRIVAPFQGLPFGSPESGLSLPQRALATAGFRSTRPDVFDNRSTKMP